MPVFNFFRNLFGLNRQDPQYEHREDNDNQRESFRKPIWESDEEDGDIDDFRRPRNRMQFDVFSDPLEMARFFESQLDDMAKSFFSFGSNGTFESFDNELGESPNRFFFSFGPQGIPFDGETPPDALPFHKESKKEKSLRDDFLKPGYEVKDKNSDPKIDQDLDGKIGAKDLMKLWKNEPSNIGAVQEYKPKRSFQSFGQSMSTRIVKLPDGSVEQHKTVRDSEGNEEITVTRQIGDKKYTVVTKKDKTGAETKIEDLYNMDENELKTFEDKWKKPVLPSEPGRRHPGLFSWNDFFGPNPKL